MVVVGNKIIKFNWGGKGLGSTTFKVKPQIWSSFSHISKDKIIVISGECQDLVETKNNSQLYLMASAILGREEWP